MWLRSSCWPVTGAPTAGPVCVTTHPGSDMLVIGFSRGGLDVMSASALPEQDNGTDRPPGGARGCAADLRSVGTELAAAGVGCPGAAPRRRGSEMNTPESGL